MSDFIGAVVGANTGTVYAIVNPGLRTRVNGIYELRQR